MAFDEKDLKNVRGEIADVRQQADAARKRAEKVEADVRAANDGAVPVSEFDKVDAAYRSADEMEDRAAELGTIEVRMMARASGRTEKQVIDGRHAPQGAPESLGARINSHPSIVAARNKVRVTRGAQIGITDPIEDVITREQVVGGRLRTVSNWFNQTDAGADSAGLILKDYRQNIVEQLVLQPTILDFLTVGATNSSTISWVVEKVREESGIVPAAYGTAAGIAQYSFERAEATVKRIPGMVVTDKGVLQDEARTETLLNTRLLAKLRLVLESEVWAGTGVGDHVKGILHTDYASQFLTLNANAMTRYDAIHKAMTKQRVETNGHISPKVVLIHPYDYEDIALAKDSLGRYLVGEPTGATIQRPIWGLLPIQTTLVNEGAPYVGDLAELATVLIRTGVSVAATDQHEDFFSRGLVGWLAEMRAGVAVEQPKALVSLSNFTA